MLDSVIINPEFDYYFKLIVIGDPGVGKTTLIKKFSTGEYKENYISTIGMDQASVYRDIDGKKVRLLIWDTAGQERFKSLTTSYYHSVNGVVLVFDCTNIKSFKSIRFWHNEVTKLCRDDVQIVLVSTKNDCESVISKDLIDEFCDEFSIKYIETSSKNGVGVDIMFNYLTLKIYSLLKPEKSEKEKEENKQDYVKKGKAIALELNNKMVKECCQ